MALKVGRNKGEEADNVRPLLEGTLADKGIWRQHKGTAEHETK